MVVNSLNRTFAALSDPTRRKIVTLLKERPATIHELTVPFSVSQQAISKHVVYLEKADLVEKKKVGREQYCQLKPEGLRLVSDWTEDFRDSWESRYQALDRVLEKMKKE